MSARRTARGQRQGGAVEINMMTTTIGVRSLRLCAPSSVLVGVPVSGVLSSSCAPRRRRSGAALD
eukprot:4024923-Pyramimonas_sp.AAC.1